MGSSNTIIITTTTIATAAATAVTWLNDSVKPAVDTDNQLVSQSRAMELA